MRLNNDAIQKPTIGRPIVPSQPGIAIGGCFPHPPIIKLDPDRFEFGKRDKDRDGALSKEEFGASKLGSRQFAEYDRNQDGKLSYTEFNNGRDFDRMNEGNLLTEDDHLTSEEYGPGLFKQQEFFRYDSNHDGKLTRDEFAAGRAKEEGAIHFPHPLPPLPFPPHPQPWPIEKPPYIRRTELEDLVLKAKTAQEAPKQD